MKSAMIVPFPRKGRTATLPLSPSECVLNTRQGSQPAHKMPGWKIVLHWTLGLIWLLVGLSWPLLERVGALDVVFQCLRALYFSNTPALHATWQAGLHAGGYLLVTSFYYLYRPKVF